MSGAGAGAPCGCCSGLTQETPEAIANRPALPAIAYRAGRHATFNASMLADLSGSSYPALAPLRTRDSADFSIALLDAWAVTLDILAFYQERLANEAYLRTAIDQRSVFELARLVGYVPSPGVTASAVLAFTLSSAPGSPDGMLIPAGTRVQSVPGPGQTAQVFETSADLNALIGWNALPAQTTVPWGLAGADTSTWVAGTTTGASPGDALLFVRAVNGQPNATGPGDVHYVTAVAPDPASGKTQIQWDKPLSASFGPGDGAGDVCLYIFRKKAALYGVQAPNPQTLAGTNIPHVPGYPSTTPPSPTWDYIYTDGSDQVNLDASYPGLAPPAKPSDGPPQWIVLTGTSHGYTSFFQVTATTESSPDYYTLTAKTTRLTLAMGRILSGDTALSLNEVLYLFVQETPDITAYVQSAPLTLADLPATAWSLDGSYPRPPGMLTPVAGSSVTVTGGQQIAPGQPVGLSGKCLRIQVSGGTFTPARQSGGSEAAAGQVFVTGSFPPGTDPATGNLLWPVRTVSGAAGTLSVPAGAFQLVPSAPADPVAGEAAVVQSVAVQGDLAALTLTAPLGRLYDAGTVTLNANAVLATDGQTVQEILGSGDASNSALQFTLKQAPLTYLPAASASGTQSTLQVWVNNLRWSEIPSMLTAGPADRVFVTGTDASGHTVVRFGNGIQGARTPTGTANIRAVYRTGIGSAGMVGAGQLSQPLDRPQGLSSVTNPGAASGAADPASADQARASAPLPTLTIGRVVSLQDYQNYALGFAGIGKALASWTWFGSVRGVFLTVAGQDGGLLSADDPVVTSLIGAIGLGSDPHVPLRVASYVPVLFTFSAAVKMDQANYPADQVLAQVWQALSTAFAFGSRQLGQGVVASEIVQLIQQVPGVIAARLEGLEPSGQPAREGGAVRLCASGPQPPAGAQLLQLDPATQGRIGVWP